MKPDKHFVTAAAIVVAAACLIGLTWVGTNEAIRDERLDNLNRVNATLSNQALTLTEQINRQILGIDQTLRILATAWASNPHGFDLEAWRKQAVVLNGLSRDMVLTDENGIIRQSSVSEAINQNASSLDYFRALADPSNPDDHLYIGPAAIDGIMRQWHMNVARALVNPDGSFAGLIDADYRIAAITDVFSQTNLGQNAFLALVGLDDGKVRGAVSATTFDPDASIAETPMFAAIQAGDSGLWTGPSAYDAVRRIHAYRHIPDRRLAVVVAMSQEEAMRPARIWRQQAEFFAGCISALLAGLALVLLYGTRLARRRAAQMRESRALLAASNAQFEVARALAAAKTEQLEATLAGMSEAASLLDAHMCLIEWNARFPEVAGVSAEILRVGLPMEEMLRSQIKSGQFGPVQNLEAEVAHRMAQLRGGPFGVMQQQRSDGRTIEMRRHRLPDGGLVMLLTDITERVRADEALRDARAAVAAAKSEKFHLAAAIGEEIRASLDILFGIIRLLGDSVLAPAQRSLLATARRAGDALSSLAGDIADMRQIEAGTLSIRPGLFELRSLLDICVERVAGQAAERGLSLHLSIAEGTPSTLLTDEDRLRQVLINLASSAMKCAEPGEMHLIAEPGHDTREAIRLTVRVDGPAIAVEAREALSGPASETDRSDSDQPVMAGLGLSLCRHLIMLLGGRIGCDARQSAAGREGSAFWITLPAAALPYRAADDAMAVYLTATQAEALSPPNERSERRPPRTRVLLTEDVVANQRVVAALLRQHGHYVDLASDGAAAIEAIRTTPYDLVFMDIVMPGMNGQEATRIIRGLSEPACSTPIIALTANASPDDEADFDAAGMNGLLAKPVSPTGLLQMLRLHVWAAPDDAERAQAPSDVHAPSVPAVLSAHRINELRTNLPPATFAQLVEECLLDLDRRLPALRRAIATGAPGAITAHAHAMVGMAASYGMVTLEDRLRSVMNAGREGDLTPLGPTIIADLERDFELAANSLRAVLRTEMA